MGAPVLAPHERFRASMAARLAAARGIPYQPASAEASPAPASAKPAPPKAHPAPAPANTNAKAAPAWADFGEAIRAARFRRGMAIGLLRAAALVGVRPHTYASWERGTRRPSREQVKALAKRLKKSAEELRRLAGYEEE